MGKMTKVNGWRAAPNWLDFLSGTLGQWNTSFLWLWRAPVAPSVLCDETISRVHCIDRQSSAYFCFFYMENMAENIELELSEARAC
jgi:hypothetical protein